MPQSGHLLLPGGTHPCRGKREPEMPLLHPTAKLVHQVWSWSGTLPSGHQDQSWGTPNTSTSPVSRVFVTSLKCLRVLGRQFDREELAPHRQSCLLVPLSPRPRWAQTDSAVRSHSFHSSRCLTPPHCPAEHSESSAAQPLPSAGPRDGCTAVIASTHRWAVKLQFIKALQGGRCRAGLPHTDAFRAKPARSWYQQPQPNRSLMGS